MKTGTRVRLTDFSCSEWYKNGVKVGQPVADTHNYIFTVIQDNCSLPSHCVAGHTEPLDVIVYHPDSGAIGFVRSKYCVEKYFCPYCGSEIQH